MDYQSPIPETRMHYHYRGFPLMSAKLSAHHKIKRKEGVEIFKAEFETSMSILSSIVNHKFFKYLSNFLKQTTYSFYPLFFRCTYAYA